MRTVQSEPHVANWSEHGHTLKRHKYVRAAHAKTSPEHIHTSTSTHITTSTHTATAAPDPTLLSSTPRRSRCRGGSHSPAYTSETGNVNCRSNKHVAYLLSIALTDACTPHTYTQPPCHPATTHQHGLGGRIGQRDAVHEPCARGQRVTET